MLKKTDTDTAATQDWTWPRVKAALEEVGMTLSALARKHGIDNSLLTKASPNATAERLIAEALGNKPWEIGPTRYSADGVLVVPLEWRKRHNTTMRPEAGNVQKRKVA